MAEYPIAQLNPQQQDVAQAYIESLTSLAETNQVVDRSIVNWLALEFGLEKMRRGLSAPSALTDDGFIKAVRESLPKRRKLTVAELAELRREHAETIEPARQARAQIFALENQLSNLVNEAYGLTPEEVALMWRTAPPRMPFTPAGLATDSDAGDDVNGEDEDE